MELIPFPLASDCGDPSKIPKAQVNPVFIPMKLDPAKLTELVRLAEQRRVASVAGSALARLRRGYRRNRQRRKIKTWTGYLGNRRAWRGQKIVLPDGKLAILFGIVRGRAVVFYDDPWSIEQRVYRVFKTDQLRPYRLPAAVALGACKRGIKERRSPAKVAQCRTNGMQPVRPGSRPRGRPPKCRHPDSSV